MQISAKFIASLREWAAFGDDLLLSVFINEYAIALFKDDIDECKNDEELVNLLKDRYAARIIK